MSEPSRDTRGGVDLVEVLEERVRGSLPAYRGLLAVSGQHHDVVGQGEHPRREATQHRRVVSAGQVGASDRAGEEQVAGEHDLADLGLVDVRRAERDGAAGVAGRVVDHEVEAGQLEGLPVGELGNVVGLGELVAAAEQHAGRLAGHPGHRIGQKVPVVRVDPGGGVVGARDRRHTPHVVDVTVGDQDRHRLEPVLADHLGDAVRRVLAGIDDHALSTGTGGDDVAVRPPRTGGETCDEHASNSCCARGWSGGASLSVQKTPLEWRWSRVTVTSRNARGGIVTAQPNANDSFPDGAWGRVAADGTVYVRTTDGERAVGQYPEGSPDEALAFFTRRYDALAFEVELLEQRVHGAA